MKHFLQMEMYYVREYTPTYRFLKIIDSTFLRVSWLFLGIYSWSVFSITYLDDMTYLAFHAFFMLYE